MESPPPYEYEYEKLPIDLILGGDHIRIALSAGATIAELQAEWQPDLESFVELSRSVHMYR